MGKMVLRHPLLDEQLHVPWLWADEVNPLPVSADCLAYEALVAPPVARPVSRIDDAPLELDEGLLAEQIEGRCLPERRDEALGFLARGGRREFRRSATRWSLGRRAGA